MSARMVGAVALKQPLRRSDFFFFSDSQLSSLGIRTEHRRRVSFCLISSLQRSRGDSPHNGLGTWWPNSLYLLCCPMAFPLPLDTRGPVFAHFVLVARWPYV